MCLPGWRMVKRLLGALAFMALLCALAWLFHARLLDALGRLWTVNNPAPRVDAIVVLGGGVETRPLAAAALYQAGVAPIILYMNVRVTPAQKLGITLAEADETRQILQASKVPASALHAIGSSVASTFDESRAVRQWAMQHHLRSVEIVTDPFHTRRARWVFARALRGSGVAIHMDAVPTLDYNLDDWWKNEQGVIAFQNEVVKYLYYRVAH